MKNTPEHPCLPTEAYTSSDWFNQERRSLYANNWFFAGTAAELSSPGTYVTARQGGNGIIVIRDRDNNLRAHHNMCRHRGTEILEGRGKLGKTIVCPYHHWTYGQDGRLMGLPDRQTCFPDLDTSGLGLLPASVADFKGLIFVHPKSAQADMFDNWMAIPERELWPHSFENMEERPSYIYEIGCNWKVFYENAIDGYHLSYLHKETLGGTGATGNQWDRHGNHMLWYSTERQGEKRALPELVERHASGPKIKGAEDGAYAGVYMLYPSTIITASPYDFSVATLSPVKSDVCRLHVRVWQPKSGWFGMPGKPAARPVLISSETATVHPAKSGDFMMEDIWICEKIQRSMSSPYFGTGPLARGAGGEDPIGWFRQMVLSDCSR